MGCLVLTAHHVSFTRQIFPRFHPAAPAVCPAPLPGRSADTGKPGPWNGSRHETAGRCRPPGGHTASIDVKRDAMRALREQLKAPEADAERQEVEEKIEHIKVEIAELQQSFESRAGRQSLRRRRRCRRCVRARRRLSPDADLWPESHHPARQSDWRSCRGDAGEVFSGHVLSIAAPAFRIHGDSQRTAGLAGNQRFDAAKKTAGLAGSAGHE
jgi:hypothetical protein